MPKLQSPLKISHQKSRLILRALVDVWKLKPRAVAGYFAGAILEISGSLMTIYATAQLGNLLAKYVTGHSTGKIWFWLVVDVISAIVIGLGFWVMSYFNKLTYFAIAQSSAIRYMSKLCQLDYPDYYDQKVRNQINKVDSGFSWIMPELSHASLDLCYGILRLMAITAVVSQIAWWLFPVILLFLIPSLMTEARTAKILWWVWDSKGDERHIYWGLAHHFKQARSQMEIRSSQAINNLIGKIKNMNKVFYNEQEKKYKDASRLMMSAKIFEAGGVAIGSIILIKRFLNGKIGFDSYLFLSGALLRIGGALNTVFGTLSRMQEQLQYAESYYEFIDRPIKMLDKPGAIKLDDRKIPDIKIEALNFSYPDSKVPIFQNLSLNIKPGEHLAIVGENGAGKSTLIKLLLRFYYPNSGSIKINGSDLNDIAIDSWYKHIASLFQDFNRYPLTIRENIILSEELKPADDKRLTKAIGLAGLDAMNDKLPKGLDTVLDSSFKDGVEPSGGQYQRVALARAFYRDAAVLILDEPTASIDAKAEFDIFNNIFEHYKNKTTIIVSHRFSTVRRADRIVVLDDGKIVEEGSHADLMKHDGLYKEMFSKQAEGYQ